MAKVSTSRNVVHLERFIWQMEYLRKNSYHTISVAQLEQYLSQGKTLPQKSVVLTFDDGYVDNYELALPVLKQYGLTASVFVVAGWVGRECGWRKAGQRDTRLMNWDELRQWQNAGMEVGAHTMEHPKLSELSENEIRQELVRSKQLLEDNLQIPITVLCYPYGDFDSRVQEIAQETGFKAALAIHEGVSLSHNDLFALRRVGISSRLGQLEFMLKVSPLHPFFIWMRQIEKKIKFKR